MNTLPPSFFARPTLQVCKELLGAELVRRHRGRISRHVITDVEAYHGFEDQASHARFGRTARNAVMFGPPGVWYVYLVYGMHAMLNIVTEDDGSPAAILIRGTQEHEGPGRLTRALSIDRTISGKPAVSGSGLWIEKRTISVPKTAIRCSPRIGVDYAGKWAKKPWRFTLPQGIQKVS